MAEPKPPEVIAELLRQSPPLPEEARVVNVFLKRARLLMIADVKENFDKSAGPDGTPWKPLKFPRPRGGNKPLLDTGMLRASVTGGSPEFRADTGLNYVSIGTVRPGANLMHAGGTVVPTGDRLLAPPPTGVGLVPTCAGGVTRLPPTGTGMARIACSSPRSRSGQRTVRSHDRSPSMIWLAGRPATAVPIRRTCSA